MRQRLRTVEDEAWALKEALAVALPYLANNALRVAAAVGGRALARIQGLHWPSFHRSSFLRSSFLRSSFLRASFLRASAAGLKGKPISDLRCHWS